MNTHDPHIPSRRRLVKALGLLCCLSFTGCGRLAPPPAQPTATPKPALESPYGNSGLRPSEIGVLSPDSGAAPSDPFAVQPYGWLSWRGPQQNGTSRETHLLSGFAAGDANELWRRDAVGRAPPIIANGRVYAVSVVTDGGQTRETLTCYEAETGKPVWSQAAPDFLSATPTAKLGLAPVVVDRATGNVYWLGSSQVLAAFTHDGKALWQRSLVEELGVMPASEGRYAPPVVDGDLVIVHGLCQSGPWTVDRFFAFEKNEGVVAWTSSPGMQAERASASTPIVGNWSNKRVMLCGTGCGSVVSVDAVTGQPIWRAQVSQGPIDSSVVMHGIEKMVVVLGPQADDPEHRGQVVGLRVPTRVPEPAEPGKPFELDANYQAWRIPVSTSEKSPVSPVLYRDHAYVPDKEGNIHDVDPVAGTIRQTLNVQAGVAGQPYFPCTPLFADGKLYFTTRAGGFMVIRAGEQPMAVLSRTLFPGEFTSGPVAWNGRIVFATNRKIYAYGSTGDNAGAADAIAASMLSPSPFSRTRSRLEDGELQLLPSDLSLKPGAKAEIRVRLFDPTKSRFEPIAPSAALWTLAPAAVLDHDGQKATSSAKPGSKQLPSQDDDGQLIAPPRSSVGPGVAAAVTVQYRLKTPETNVESKSLSATAQVRILPAIPFEIHFSDTQLDQIAIPPIDGRPMPYASIPSGWIGARGSFEIESFAQSVALTSAFNAPTPRIVFFGHPDEKDYSLTADVFVEADQQMHATAGLINQRYLFMLEPGKIVVTTGADRFRKEADSNWRTGVWCRLKTAVIHDASGTAIIRAKAWNRDEPEPSKWHLETSEPRGNGQGAPGIYVEAPGNALHACFDRIVAAPADK